MPPCEPIWSCERGVTEVIGYILTFGILAVILVMSMLAFNDGKEQTEQTLVELQAEAVAHRISTVIVDAALFGERHADDGEFYRLLDLPEAFQGRSYTVTLQSADAGGPDRIDVSVGSMSVSAILFSAGSASQFSICDTTLPGDQLVVRYGPDPLSPSDRCLFLEEP